LADVSAVAVGHYRDKRLLADCRQCGAVSLPVSKTKVFDKFEKRKVCCNGIEINCRVGGTGPALLLLHGHPQTLFIWHRVAEVLSDAFTVVAADLRGYGDSDKPPASVCLHMIAAHVSRIDCRWIIRTLRSAWYCWI
jgi:pimeloyl-ACP methyl ester carboxylesterase